MKIMTCFAHPADTITNCGGTLARHADAGDEIVAVILTHGGRIHPNKYAEEWRRENPDDQLTAAGILEIAENKKQELRRAAEVIGIGELVLLDHDDTMATVHEEVVAEVAEQIAIHSPDVIIADYPQNPVVTLSSHTIATMTLLAALDRASTFLRNVDGRAEVDVKQVFFSGNPVLSADSLSAYGQRADCYIDITETVGRKIAAMDCFPSQGYDGDFARKLVEANNGEHGRYAGVNFAEAYTRFRNETHALLPLTEHAQRQDILTRHRDYSVINLRERFPVRPGE